jgi:hypothetical protein
MNAIRRAARSFRALIATRLGACAFCIRLSLALSVVSWLLWIGIHALVPGSLAAMLVFVPALGFTGLFGSHLAAYAVRVVLAYRMAGQVAPRETPASIPNRRRFLVLSARTIGLALVPSVLVPTLWGSVTDGPCQTPPNCNPAINPCCCKDCKTQLKPCDPRYLSCSVTCGGGGLIECH